MDLNAILHAEASANHILSVKSETYNAVTKLKAQTEAEYEGAQRELLGEAGYRRLTVSHLARLFENRSFFVAHRQAPRIFTVCDRSVSV